MVRVLYLFLYTVDHRDKIPGNMPGRDMRHMEVSDAATEFSPFARTPLSVMTNQKCITYL